MFKKISEGNVVCHTRGESKAAGSRIAVLPDGKLACTFNVKAKTESNDCITMISYSADGENWSEAKPVWPDLVGKQAHFTAIRNTLDGRVCIGGFCFPNYDVNQNWWSGEIGGMLENSLIVAVSDDGYDFSNHIEVPLPYYGAAENPGGAFVDKDGTIYILYAPYRTIEGKEDVNVNRLVAVKSTDNGKIWEPIVFGEIDGPCQYGESWLVRLRDDIHMAASWQTASKTDADKYFLSYDGAKTFEGPMNMPFNGQSIALEALGDGRVLVIYNLRNQEPAGVYMALAKPDKNGFNMLANECIWQAEKKTVGDSSGEFDDWTDFAFGEPHVKLLPDGTLIASLWYDTGSEKGIRYVKLAIEE